MAPVIPCSSGAVTLLTKASFSQKRDTQFMKCNVSRRSSRTPLSGHRFLQSTSLRLLQQSFTESHFRQSPRTKPLAAIGADIVTEEPNAAVKDEQLDTPAEASPESAEPDTVETSVDASSVAPSNQLKRTRPVRRSSMPPVKNEELVPGASFTGKVRSIQPFGAFVDFGAFTDGLVHVSKLSDEFVKDVANVVSVGQEVKVRLVDANMETGRISLTMRDSDDVGKSSSGDSDRPNNARRNAARSNQRRNEPQKTSKFVKGQVLDGTVKNITRSGAYISLPDGEEGFLPTSEESEGFGNILGNSSLQVGQEVNVRVLRISRGQATLTMKKEEDVEAINMKLNQGVVHTATNPFVLAFRKNKDIAAFLDEREKPEEYTRSDSGVKVDVILPKEAEELEAQNSISTSDNQSTTSPTSMDPLEEQTDLDSDLSEVTSAEDNSTVLTSDDSISSADSATGKAYAEMETKDDGYDDSIPSALSLQETESSTDSPILESCEDLSSVNSTTTEASLETETNDDGHDDSSLSASSLQETDSNTDRHNDPTDSVKPEASFLPNEVSEEGGAVTVEDITSNASSEEVGKEADSVIQVEPEAEASIGRVNLSQKHNNEISSSEDEVSEAVATNQVDSNADDDKVENGTPLPSESEEASNSASIVTNDAVSNEQNTPVQDTSATASVSAALVKQLREETGAGMMDCKNALAETGGDIIKAQEFLRKKGLASADKKASRATAEGRIGSYIHDSRIGVLIEVNCETDFVSRGDIFKELVDDLAMQVAACPQVQYLVTEDVPEEIVTKEREVEMQKEDLLTKPEQIRSKIVDGRIRKRLEEFALLEQPYIKNDKMVVKDLVKQTIATIGENIKVKRFVRYNLGEGLEKKSQDFAAEVAAQTTTKEPASAPKDQSPVTPDDQQKKDETTEKFPVVTVSAALVKQLREETGAGMMDCKKALAETGGDIEKAQEYLRKKGLSSADKKSLRLAAEGRISTYIHDSRIGVLLEVNSETDFVARNETFKELVDDLAMQIVACPQVEFVSVEDVPESVVNKEKELEMQREDLQSKPENIREKIVEGRVSKRLGELALSEQPFIKNDTLLVKDLVKQTVAALGENIRVRRFVKFTLGE